MTSPAVPGRKGGTAARAATRKPEAAMQCDRMILTHFGTDMSKARNDVRFDTADDGLKVKL